MISAVAQRDPSPTASYRVTARPSAATAAGLFAGVFPADVSMIRLRWVKARTVRIAASARPPLQIPLATVTLKIWSNS